METTNPYRALFFPSTQRRKAKFSFGKVRTRLHIQDFRDTLFDVINKI